MNRTDRDELTKILFNLEQGGEQDIESLWAARVGPQLYRLENSPFYFRGVSFQDVVFAEEHEDGVFSFVGVARPGGHSTYRIMLSRGVTQESALFRERWDALEAIGCTYENADDRLFAVDVPPETDVHEAYALLERGEASGVWDFEEAHYGHPIGGQDGS